MSTPLYEMYGPASAMPSQVPSQMSIQNMNPAQKRVLFYQALANPAAFIQQYAPGIPENIRNNPYQILQFMQQQMGLTNQQIQQIAAQGPRF